MKVDFSFNLSVLLVSTFPFRLFISGAQSFDQFSGRLTRNEKLNNTLRIPMPAF